MSLRFRILLVASIILAIASTWFKAHWDQTHQALVPELVAAHDIPAYTKLTREDLAYRQIPQGGLDLEAVEQPDRLIGQELSMPIYRGEPFRPERLLSGLQLQPDERAIGVETDLVRSVAATLRRGDHVDVYLQSSVDRSASTPIATDLMVLDVKTATAQAAGDPNGAAVPPAAVVLKANVTQAGALAVASGTGKLLLVKRPMEKTTDGD